ncbi:hypothetical protein [Emergencia sp. 1XD21-10]|uniref:hypothetical protein n=1 Tax=Emergencia sp. 1XD21-10 TaxID=2304569 RepID=UPI001379DC6C|nr:hypothetical protein [Emergencia sp. 1XD21-10]NCE99421.1 hypothetical protein [Emergencia sp. 1XD21-10]
MGNLIKFEWKKLFQWRFLFIFLPLIFILNGILVLEQITGDFEKKETFQEDSWTENRSENKNESYEAFLLSIELQAEDMQNTAIFNTSYFNRKNLEKTKNAYSRLHGIELEPDYPTGLRYVTDYRMTDCLLLFSVLALLIQLMLQERAEGLLHLLKPTLNGKGRLIFAKYVTFVLGALILTILFYGTNYFLAAVINSLGKGDAAIQSLEGYLASPFAINIRTYFWLFLLCKWLAVTAINSIFFLFCIYCRNHVYAILCSILTLSVELLLWLTVKDYAWLSPVKHFNLAAILDTSHFFNDYTNFNFLGIPVSAVMAGLVTSILSIIISLTWSIKLFISEASSEAKKSRWLKKFRMKACGTRISVNLFSIECKKMLFMQKGLFLLLALLVIQALFYYENYFFSDQEEAYYQRYSQVLAGELSKEKADWIERKEEYFRSLDEELEKQYQRYQQGLISATVLDYYIKKLTPRQAEQIGFDRAKTQYQYVEEQRKNGLNVAYLYDTGWNKLLGSEGRREELLDFAKLFLIMILALSSLGTIEKTSSVELLILPSAKGIKGINHIKTILCTMYSLVAAAITFVWRPMQILNYYEMSGSQYSVQSLLLFSQIKWQMSLGVYVTLIYLLKGVIAILVGQFLFYLSRKCTHDSTVLFLSSLLLVVPVVAVWFYLGL